MGLLLAFRGRSRIFCCADNRLRHRIGSVPSRPIRSMNTSSSSPARPEWLATLLRDTSEGPRMYAWTPSNLPGQAARTNDQPAARTDDEKRRIYILGVGNIGRLFATSLARLSPAPPITLVVHRRDLLEQWALRPGIEMSRSGTVETISSFDMEWWTEEAPAVGPAREIGGGGGGVISNLIVATKAQAALPQVDALRRYLGGDSAVAFAQNGVSKLWPPFGPQYSEARFGADHPSFIACVTMHGVYSLGPFRSVHAALADVILGPVLLGASGCSGARYLMGEILRAPGLDAAEVSSRDLWVSQLEKLVVNCVVNPLTAILRCRNGGLFTDPGGDTARLMDVMLREASAVLQALVRDPGSRPLLRGGGPASEGPEEEEELRVTEAQLLERFSFPRLRAMLYRAADKIAENNSSMFQDVQAGKPTEIRDLNGWLVDTAGYLSPTLGVGSHRRAIDLVESRSALTEEQLRSHFPALA